MVEASANHAICDVLWCEPYNVSWAGANHTFCDLLWYEPYNLWCALVRTIQFVVMCFGANHTICDVLWCEPYNLWCALVRNHTICDVLWCEPYNLWCALVRTIQFVMCFGANHTICDLFVGLNPCDSNPCFGDATCLPDESADSSAFVLPDTWASSAKSVGFILW